MHLEYSDVLSGTVRNLKTKDDETENLVPVTIKHINFWKKQCDMNILENNLYDFDELNAIEDYPE